MLVYTLRPDNTALWLPEAICKALKIKDGQRLTAEQFSEPSIADLVQRRKDVGKGFAPLE